MPEKYLITESELKHIIKNVCKTVIREELQNYLITEMAYSLKEYKIKADNLIPQIVENWCLIRYCTLTNDKEDIKEHWKKELIAHMLNIGQMKLKNGNSLTSKQKALYFLWNQRDIDSDENIIHLYIALKFEEEGIPIKGKIYSQIINDFKNSTKDIVNALISGSYSNIIKYVNSI